MRYYTLVLLIILSSCTKKSSQEEQASQEPQETILNTSCEENSSLIRIEQQKGLTYYYPNFRKVGLIVDATPLSVILSLYLLLQHHLQVSY